MNENMILAGKCAPDEKVLSEVCQAKLEAVELYLSRELLCDAQRVSGICKKFPLRYAIHAPNEGLDVDLLADLANDISAEVVVFHNVYWEDEWPNIIDQFKDMPVRLCMENTYSVHEPVKFMRRYGMGRCLDLEHLQMECAGVYDDVFVTIMREASHVHLTGYTCGSSLWHTHVHHSPEEGMHMLSLLKRSGYSGFVVSEAQASLQTYQEFKALREFYDEWERESDPISGTGGTTIKRNQ